MLPNAGNILDQLLGGFDPTQMPTLGASQKAAGGAEVLPFGNLLSMLVNGQQMVVSPQAETADPMPTEVPLRPIVPLEQFLGNLNSNEIPAEAAKPLVSDDLNTLVADDNAGWLEDKSSAVSELLPAAFAARPGVIVPNTFIANQNIRNLTGEQPIELEPGIYKVLDAKINGDNLELTIVTDDQNAEPVKLSVPSELLAGKDAVEALATARGQHPKTLSATGAERIPLVDFNAPATENLDNLLSKLNLKAIEVKLEPVTNAASTEKQQVTLEMFGVVGGNQVVVKSKLDKQQIDLRTDNKLTHLQAPKANSTTSDVNTPRISAVPTKLEPRVQEKPVVLSVQDFGRRMTFDLIDKLTADKNTAQLESAGLQTNHVTASAEMSARLDNSAPTVQTTRVSLPPNFEQMLRPGGQSVTLKIEPEHLGPARLHLSMDHNGLSARVTVDSAVAKMTVEHSLQQLTDQLSRAGIHVDRIEVTLSGRDAHEQFFYRRPDWAQAENSGSGQPDEDFELEQVTPSPTLYIPPTEFVRAGGVNLLV